MTPETPTQENTATPILDSVPVAPQPEVPAVVAAEAQPVIDAAPAEVAPVQTEAAPALITEAPVAAEVAPSQAPEVAMAESTPAQPVIDSAPVATVVQPEVVAPQAPAAGEPGSRENPTIVDMPNGSTVNTANIAASTKIGGPDSFSAVPPAPQMPETAPVQAPVEQIPTADSPETTAL